MDYRLEHWINGFAGSSTALDRLMVDAAQWSEVAFLGLVVGWFLVGWITGRRADRRGAITAGLAAVLSLAINQVITHLWQRSRPFVAHPGSVHLLMSHSKDPSFPSDHAAPAMAIAVALLFVRHRAGLLAVLAALVVGIARVYAGVHYPADILGGFVIGAACAVVLSTSLRPAVDRLRVIGDGTIRALRLPLPDRV